MLLNIGTESSCLSVHVVGFIVRDKTGEMAWVCGVNYGMALCRHHSVMIWCYKD